VRLLRDAEHLLRVLGLFLAGLVVFLGLRAWLVPAGFGTLGHYRPGALDDNRQGPLVHAGRAACAECHEEPARRLASGAHARVGCESCHGAQGAHARAPEEGTPRPPDAARLCLGCHRALVGRPAAFPQVDPADHAGEAACTECHVPHHPAQAPGGE
jgi:hypothetical protein